MNSNPQTPYLAIYAPMPGRYVASWRAVKSACKANPHALVIRGDWFGRTVAELKASYDDALQARINARGGLEIRQSTDEEWAHRRDQRKLHDYIRHRIVHPGSGFETKECRRRFAWVQERMTCRD